MFFIVFTRLTCILISKIGATYIMKKKSIVLAALLSSGCSTTGMFNTYIDFSDVSNVSEVSQNQRNQSQSGQRQLSQNNCTTLFQGADTDGHFEDAFLYTCFVRNKYRKAMGNRSSLRRKSIVPILGLGAVGVGLGLSGYDTTTILATTLTGATIAGGARLYDTSSDERAYVLGAEALNCAMQAVTPLARPADNREMALFDLYLSASGDENIEVSSSTLKAAMLAAEASLMAEDIGDKKTAVIKKQISVAKELITLTETTVRNARSLRTQRIQAPAMLWAATDRIIGQVDSAIQTNAVSIDATVSVITSLASSYKTFTAVPTDLSVGTSPATTAGDSVEDGSDAPSVPVLPNEVSEALQNNNLAATVDIFLKEREIAIAMSDVEIAQNHIDGADENFRTNSLDAFKEMEGNLELKENTLSRLEGELETLKEQRQGYLDALERAANSYASALDEHTKLLKQPPKNKVDRRSFQLNEAITTVNMKRRLLADVVNSVVALKPSDALKSCGVDADSVAAGLTLSPARLEFSEGTSGSQFVIINGGQAPFSASLASGNEAITLEKADPFSSSFSVSYEGEVVGRSDILIVDGTNTRLVLPVNVSPKVETRSQVEGRGRLEDIVVLVELSVDEKAKVSAQNLSVAGSDVERLQRAVCMLAIDGATADGKWGPKSQKQYEVNRSVYGIPTDDNGIVTAEIVSKIEAKLKTHNAFDNEQDNLSCTRSGALTLPVVP